MMGRFFVVIIVGLVIGATAFGAQPSPMGGLKPMGRLRTIGFEVLPPAISSGAGQSDIEGVCVGTFGSADTGDPRSGFNSYRALAGNFTNGEVYIQSLTNAATIYYARAYAKFYSSVGSSMTVMAWGDQTNPTPVPTVGIKLTAANKLQLWNLATNTQIGSDSPAVITGNNFASPWYRLELSFSHASGSADWGNVEFQLDGTSVASGTATNAVPTMSGSNGILLGFLDAIAVPSGLLEIHFDDVAINDNQGANQNSWPGEGHIIGLLPISDNARGTWTGGAGGTTNLFDAVNNNPPVGLAVASETNTSQIKSLTSSATDNCDLNMTTYATAGPNVVGMTQTDTATVIQTIINHAEGIATGTKAGAVKIVSNPVQSVEDAFTYGGDSGAAGTFPSSWVTTWGTPQYNPSIVITTSPVLRVGKRTATTREVDVDLMAMEVEYVQGLPIAAFHPFMDGPWTNTLLRM